MNRLVMDRDDAVPRHPGTDNQAERIAALERENRWLRATLATVITISESSIHAQAVSRIRSLCLAIRLRAEEGLRGADLANEGQS